MDCQCEKIPTFVVLVSGAILKTSDISRKDVY